MKCVKLQKTHSMKLKGNKTLAFWTINVRVQILTKTSSTHDDGALGVVSISRCLTDGVVDVRYFTLSMRCIRQYYRCLLL